MSVAISAYATELAIRDGAIEFPAIGGQELMAEGVPPSWDGPLPVSPERAAELAGKRTGRRITKVPELLAPSVPDGGPHLSSWRIALDAPARLRGAKSAKLVETADVFVGRRAGVTEPNGALARSNDIELPLASQPNAAVVFAANAADLQARLGTKGDVAPPSVRREIARRSGVPVQFEPASAVPGGN